jgi:hypothetical protein
MADGRRIAACVALGFLPATGYLVRPGALIGLLLGPFLAGAVLADRPMLAGLLGGAPTLVAGAGVVAADGAPVGLVALVTLAAIVVALAHVGAGLQLRRRAT